MAEGGGAVAMEASEVAPMDPATALAWIQIRTSNAHDVRAAIADVDKFTGDIGDLAHFLKAGDRITKSVDAKEAVGWLDTEEVPALRAALINRLSRHVLNVIQADEGTAWAVVKERLKRVYGGARWAPEEDVLRMLREVKGTRQSSGSYAARLLEHYTAIAEKLGEAGNAEVTKIKMDFLESILRVQLRKETQKNVAQEKSFRETVQELMDEDAREAEEVRLDRGAPWVEVKPRKSERRAFGPPRRIPPEPRRGGNRPAARPTGGRRDAPRERRCYECGSSRHLAARCDRRKCFECGDIGHIARDCPYMSRRRPGEPEPMEVNAQRVARREREVARESCRSGESSDEGTSSERSTTSEWSQRVKRPPVVKKGKQERA